jgi:hypothetical protein
MKKLLIAVFTLFVVAQINAQTFKLGATVGIPTADSADISDFVLGIDAYYYFTDIDDTIEIGATAGFRNYFVDFGDLDDANFLPLAAAARLKLFGIVSGGADVGYAIGITDYLDGGFYFRPVVGIDIADTIELNASYESISDAANWGAFNIGILFEF